MSTEAPAFLTGPRKLLAYVRIALHVALHYLIRPRLFGCNPLRFLHFLRRALRLLLIFRHNKIVSARGGWKLHLYLPAYPGRAFFRAIESKLIRTPPGPVTVVFSMTKACSYKCQHCYQRKDVGADVPEDQLLDVARAVRAAGTSMFDIEGGEPLLRLDRLLRLCEAVRDGVEVWVNTTGQDATPDVLAQLRRVGVYGVMVSLHSPDAAAHDELTGVPGSFAVACETLRRSRLAGLVTAANTVLAEDELRAGRLAELMTLCRALQCDFVQLIHPKPAGLWLDKTDRMQTDTALLDDIRAGHRYYNSPACEDYPALAAQVFEESADVLGCTAGAVDRFYVNAHGEVQPCEFLNISFGNATQEPFDAILTRMRAAFRVPGADWLCCCKAPEIAAAIAAADGATPLPRKQTEALVATWQTKHPTPVYQRLGIYR